MSDITATASSSTITATAAGGGVSATVGAQTFAVTVGGGIGPPGAAISRLADLSDVQIVSPQTGDLLRRDGSEWKNYSEKQLVIDGGNW